MSDDLVLVESPSETTRLVTLNRPNSRNALSRALIGRLGETLDAVSRAPGVRAVVLTAVRSGEVRGATQLEQRMMLAKGAIFRHVAPGLPHEPDGSTVDGFAPACAQKTALAHAGRSAHACYIIEFVF